MASVTVAVTRVFEAPFATIDAGPTPTVTAVAEGCGRAPAQVLIRWHIQLGNIVIPKSVNPSRIESNFDVFDFELSPDEMASISALDDGSRLGPNPRTFNFTGR